MVNIRRQQKIQKYVQNHIKICSQLESKFDSFIVKDVLKEESKVAKDSQNNQYNSIHTKTNQLLSAKMVNAYFKQK